MTTTFVLAINLMCPSIEVRNNTAEWNEHDKNTIEYVQKRCGQLYPKSPCLKIFKKIEEQTYTVICGQSTEENMVIIGHPK